MATQANGSKPVGKDEVGSTEAQNDFAELLNRVAYKGERIFITRHGKRIAKLLPLTPEEASAELVDL